MEQEKTPFQRKGFSDDSVFRMKRSIGGIEEGSYLILEADTDDEFPIFRLIEKDGGGAGALVCIHVEDVEEFRRVDTDSPVDTENGISRDTILTFSAPASTWAAVYLSLGRTTGLDEHEKDLYREIEETLEDGDQKARDVISADSFPVIYYHEVKDRFEEHLFDKEEVVRKRKELESLLKRVDELYVQLGIKT